MSAIENAQIAMDEWLTRVRAQQVKIRYKPQNLRSLASFLTGIPIETPDFFTAIESSIRLQLKSQDRLFKKGDILYDRNKHAALRQILEAIEHDQARPPVSD